MVLACKRKDERKGVWAGRLSRKPASCYEGRVVEIFERADWWKGLNGRVAERFERWEGLGGRRAGVLWPEGAH